MPTLLNYLVGAAIFEWKSLRYASDVATEKGLKSVDYSTLSKRLGELNYLIVKQIFEWLVRRLHRATRRKLKLKKELMAIDSTTITVGKSRLPWALYHGERSGIKLHVSFTNYTGMPLQVVETTGLKNDGPIGVKLEDKRFILVADFTCTLGTAQKQTKKRHRVVEFTDYEGALVCVVINLRDVTAEEIAGMYKKRWAIESFFRWIQQNLNVPLLFGTTKNAVFSQFFAALLAYVLLKFLHTEGQKKNNCKPLSFAGFTHQLLCATLPIEWRIGLQEILEFHQELYQANTG